MAADADPRRLDPDVRFIVREIIGDPDTGGRSYVLSPIREYPGRSIAKGDVFAPVDYLPDWVSREGRPAPGDAPDCKAQNQGGG